MNTGTAISGAALEFTTTSTDVDGMDGQEWAQIVNEALAAFYSDVTFCDPDGLNLLVAGNNYSDVTDQISYDDFTELSPDVLVRVIALLAQAGDSHNQSLN